MPTFERLPRFDRDHANLTPEQREAFREAIRKLVADLKRGQGFRPGLRVKAVQGASGVFEMTWAADGRATFQYGPARLGAEAHVVWRRVGTHDVFGRP